MTWLYDMKEHGYPGGLHPVSPWRPEPSSDARPTLLSMGLSAPWTMLCDKEPLPMSGIGAEDALRLLTVDTARMSRRTYADELSRSG
jgi:hypothetical protein